MFRRFQKLLPRISQTERIALQSGKRSIESDIFLGKRSPTLSITRVPKISDEGNRIIEKYVKPLCQDLNNHTTTREGGLTASQIDLCRPLFGLGIPKSYGGLGLNRHDQSQIVQTVASRSVAAGVTVMVPNSLGPAELIYHYGSEPQREEILPKLAKGELIPCFGLTGTFSGSDAASMRDTGIVYRIGDDLRIRLNCEKRYITLAPIADLVGVAFNLQDPENLLSSGKSGITLALLDRGTPGLEIGTRHQPLNASFYNGPFRGEDIDFSITQVIGGINGTGEGWKMLMECLVEGRGISLPSSAISGMKLATLYTSAYGKVREQFKIPISTMQGVQEHIAEMVYHTYVSTASQYLYNSLADDHNISSTLSAILKYSTTERGRKTINHSMDVLGGIAICDGPGNLVANIYGATPVSITVEGSNTLTRSLMIYGQGLLRGHPHLLNLEEHLQNGQQNRFWNELGRSVYFGVSSISISTIENLFLPEFVTSSTDHRTRRLLRRFRNVVNIGLPTAPFLKTEQIYSGAMADTLVTLYELQATQWLYENRVEEGVITKEETAVYLYSQERLLEKGNASLSNAIDNLQTSSQKYIAKLTTMPWGYRHYNPTSQTISQVSNSATGSDDLRKLFSEGIDISQSKLLETEEIWREIEEGKSISNKRLAKILSVDEF